MAAFEDDRQRRQQAEVERRRAVNPGYWAEMERRRARNPGYWAEMERRREAHAAEMERRRVTGGAPLPQPAQPAPQNAPPAPAGRQAQQPPPEVHMHVAAPRVDNRPPLERMGDNVEDAIRDENDSRVAQARENKRMGFARDMEAMRQEGLLKRLQAMNDSQYGRPDAPQQGGGIGVWNPITQQFDYTDRVKFGP
jgi:hypothetical protein